MHKHCAICEKIDPSLPHTVNADNIGVGESTIRRHRAASATTSHTNLEDADDFFQEIPAEIITNRGRSVRLEDGSWEKITYRPAQAALYAANTYDDVVRALDGFVFQPAVHTLQLRPVASVLNAADLQIGKAQQRGGGTLGPGGTLERCMYSLFQYANEIKANPVQEIVLVDNGDGIENIFNVPSQLMTNDMDLTTQIRTFRRLMVGAIKLLAPLAPKLTYVSVPSNHGAVRSGYKTQAGTTDADFGLEISHQIEDVIAETDWADRVTFVRPEPLHETATFTAAGTKLAFHHGHQSYGQGGHGKWWAGQDHGRMPGWDADILVVAHYHNLRVEQSGDGRWIIGCSSAEPSSDWFTNRTGESSKQGMTAFEVQDGQWSNIRIV